MVVVTTEVGQTSPKREYPGGVIRLSLPDLSDSRPWWEVFLPSKRGEVPNGGERCGEGGFSLGHLQGFAGLECIRSVQFQMRQLRGSDGRTVHSNACSMSSEEAWSL